MILYVYKNLLCDPAKNIGLAKQFSNSEDLDAFLDFFCASIMPRAVPTYRIFITNDDVDFNAMDHFVLMDDVYGLDQSVHKIEEVNVWQRSVQCNQAIAAIDKRRSEEKARMDKKLKEMKEKDKEKPS